MIAQAAADIEAIATGHHDVEQEECGSLALGVGNEVGGGMEEAYFKTRSLEMMLHEPRDIGVVFENKNGLAQTGSPHPAAVEDWDEAASRNYEQSNAGRQRICKRLMNLSMEEGYSGGKFDGGSRPGASWSREPNDVVG
jgi:hypothetical protein